MKNYLNYEITNKGYIHIMRGLPGSGKSTESKKLCQGKGVVHSTDDVIVDVYGDYDEFFKNMKETNNFSNLSNAHKTNFKNYCKSVDDNIKCIIVDNTNTTPSEVKNYVEYALKNGYSDDNIIFHEIGDGGLTIEELAKRNTHNVPYDVISKMAKRLRNSGPLNLKNVIGSKGMGSKKVIKWAYIELDKLSVEKLLKATSHYIPEDYKVFAHHMTINYGKGIPNDLISDIGRKITLEATEIGISDTNIAVSVEGYPTSSKIPHITLAVSKSGTPKMSNDIVDWEKLTSKITLNGIIKQVTYN